MAEAKLFTCPSCGSSLSPEGAKAQIKCAFCGNTVIVPADLREKPAAQSTEDTDLAELIQIQVQETRAIQAHETRAAAPPVKSGGGCGSALFSLLLAIVTLGGIGLGVIASINPNFFDQFSPLGYARLAMTFGGEGTGAGLFQDARHVAVDGKGNVYVADFYTLRIQKFDATGKYVSGWTIQEEGKYKNKYGPDVLAADRAGNVYVLWTGVILKYDGNTGKFLGKFTGEVLDTFFKDTDNFHDLTLLPNGSLWAVSDARNRDDLVHLDSTGKVVARIQKVISAQVDEASISPTDLKVAVDGLGNIFVLYKGTRDPAVFRFSPKASMSTSSAAKEKPVVSSTIQSISRWTTRAASM